MTACAFELFSKNISDFNIIEFGIGGLHDPTNIISEKELSNIENPYFADDDKIREHSLYLSACQFNIEEFRNGYAMKQVEQLQHDSTYTNFKWSIK